VLGGKRSQGQRHEATEQLPTKKGFQGQGRGGKVRVGRAKVKGDAPPAYPCGDGTGGGEGEKRENNKATELGMGGRGGTVESGEKIPSKKAYTCEGTTTEGGRGWVGGATKTGESCWEEGFFYWLTRKKIKAPGREEGASWGKKGEIRVKSLGELEKALSQELVFEYPTTRMKGNKGRTSEPRKKETGSNYKKIEKMGRRKGQKGITNFGVKK